MPDERIALIAELVTQAENKLGRTALMKHLFFLKVLRNVPLPYTFRLYTYGPFDSDVLEDIRYAESLGAVESSIVTFAGGRGYEYRAGPLAQEIEQQCQEFLAAHQPSIHWVLEQFGNRSALELEMLSTLVYVDRALEERGEHATIEDIVRKVRDVKPHLAPSSIKQEAQELSEKGLLKAAA